MADPTRKSRLKALAKQLYGKTTDAVGTAMAAPYVAARDQGRERGERAFTAIVSKKLNRAGILNFGSVDPRGGGPAVLEMWKKYKLRQQAQQNGNTQQ